MNYTDLVILYKSPEELSTVKPNCPHVRLTAKYGAFSMVFRPSILPSLSDSNFSVYRGKDSHRHNH
jgi:hypothetical protein